MRLEIPLKTIKKFITKALKYKAKFVWVSMISFDRFLFT